MAFYIEKEQSYLETDASVVGLKVSLLQTRDDMQCCENRSQTTGYNFKDRCSKLITQRMILRSHQYSIRILYKPGAQSFIGDWLSRHNHETETQKYQACA